MKKILLMVVAAMMATASVNAQEEYGNEISVAYGAGSNTDLVMSLAKGVFTGKQLDYWGPISAEYFHRLTNTNRLGLGAVFALSGCKWDDTGDAKSKYYTIMPAIKYNWVVKKYVSWYSKGAVGMTIDSQSGGREDKTDVMFNFQASLVGFEFGGAFRGFVELGFGEQGIALAGLRYKF